MRCKSQLEEARRNLIAKIRPTKRNRLTPNRIIKTAKVSTPKSSLKTDSPTYTSTPSTQTNFQQLQSPLTNNFVGGENFGCSKFGNTVRQFCSSATLQFGNMTYRQRYSSATPQFGNATVRQMPIGNKPIGNGTVRQQYLSATVPIGNSTNRQSYNK